MKRTGRESVTDRWFGTDRARLTGADLSFIVGDPFEGESVSYSGGLDLGAVEIDGRPERERFMLRNSDVNDTNEYPATFELNC